MGLVITAVADLTVVVLVLLVVLFQVRPVWRDAAEHSRWFWVSWIAASVAVGVVPAAAGWWSDWVAAIWLTVCCAFATLQPALWTDVLEVRRDVARRRHVLLEQREREQARPEAPPVRWRAE